MTELLAVLLLLTALVGIITMPFVGRGRVGRPPSGVLTRWKDPTQAPYAASALCAYSLGVGVTVIDGATTLASAIIIGLLVAILVSVPLIQPYALAACGLVAVLLSIWEMARFIRGAGDYDVLKSSYRILLMALLLAFFTLGVMVFGRASALRGERGFALFGLVEVVTFLAAPAGQEVFNLTGVSHLAYLVVVSAIAFALGFAVSEYVLGVVALAVIGVGLIWTMHGPATIIGEFAGLAAAGFLFAANRLFGRSRVAGRS